MDSMRLALVSTIDPAPGLESASLGVIKTTEKCSLDVPHMCPTSAGCRQGDVAKLKKYVFFQ